MITQEFVETIRKHEQFRPTITYSIRGKSLHYALVNETALWRAQTLTTKEPSTIAWLDGIPKGSIVLDIGANVGMYSIYAAVMCEAKVFAFEPESQNYALLNQNIKLNNLSEHVRAYCAALSDKDSLESLFLSNFALGSSCHSLGEEVGFDLEPRKSPYTQGAISFSVDSLVANGYIDIPNYIKIDVDGFEHKVIQGAVETLRNPKVKSMIVELNPKLAQHLEAVKLLEELGFCYSPHQVEFAARKEGAFKGVGEWIFHRKSRYGRQVQTFFPSVVHTQDKLGEVGKLVLEKIQNTKIETDPFPHLVVDKLFPDDYYKELLRKFPSKDQMIPISETARTGSAYSNRLVTLFEKEHFKRLDIAKREFWRELGAWLYHEEFMQGVLDVFWPFIKDRVEEVSKLTGVSRISGDALIVNDQFGYGIGPHTDMLRRLITFLFYLPPDDQFRRHGTSIYVPVEKGFESDGTRHFERGLFKQRALVEFVPNRLLLFVRTNNSFHGVEKIEQAGIDRPLLINNIRLLDVK